jgi:hypothetical protein
VSIGTVSKLLTSRRGVHPETRTKIDAAIRVLGFVPDLAARSLTAAGLGPPYSMAVDVLSVVADDPDSRWATALLAERRVDTTGAGDTFTGCFLDARANDVGSAGALRLAVHASRSIASAGARPACRRPAADRPGAAGPR